MAIESYFFNAQVNNGVYDRTYGAEDFTKYLDKLVGNGVFATPASNLQVRAGTGMSVIVAAGTGWINGHKMNSTSDLVFNIDASDVLLDRIDSVIFYVDKSKREMGIEIKKGTAGTAPVAPALLRSAERYEMCLANVRVNKQVTSITGGAIEDTRFNAAVCGVVKGLIEEIDTTDLFLQYDHIFNDWFSTVKETLATTTLLRKYEATYSTVASGEKTFTVTDHVPNYNYALDILEVYVNEMRLHTGEFTVNGATVTLSHALDVVGSNVTFVVYKSIDGSEAEGVVELIDALTLRVVELENSNSKPKTATVTLGASNWVDNFDGTYSQNVFIDIIKSANDIVMVSPVQNVPVRATGQSAVGLTFTSYEKITTDVTVNVVKVGA